MKGFDAIRPEYNCFILMIISVDKAFRLFVGDLTSYCLVHSINFTSLKSSTKSTCMCKLPHTINPETSTFNLDEI